MRFSFAAVTAALLAAAPAFVRAQDPAQGQMVFVGMNGTLTFNPPQITAAPNSNVTFMFMSKNHSVWQSSFGDPCNPVASGFTADFFPVPDGSQQFPTVTIAVTQSTPIWFYCPQTNPANHCKMGMVGAINPTADKTLEQFQAIAKGEAPPPAGSSSTSPSGSAAPGAPGSPGVTTPGASSLPGGASPTGAPNGVTPPASGASGSPSPSQTGGALSQMKGASTAIAVGVFGIVAFLL